MKNIKPCNELCYECGFFNDSQVGVLKESLGLVEYIEKGIVFPCHLQLKAVTGCENKGVEDYAEKVNEVLVCRGYVESMFISKKHLDNPMWQHLYKQLDGKINPKTMTLTETLKYHGGV